MIHKTFQVDIQYCGYWGGAARVAFTEEKLKARFQNVTVNAVKDEVKTGNFIIKVGDTTVYNNKDDNRIMEPGVIEGVIDKIFTIYKVIA